MYLADMIKKVQGTTGAKLIECVNPVRNKWRIRWDIQATENQESQESVTYMEKEFDHQPTDEEIKTTVADYFNTLTDEDILSGYTWEDAQVWLSSENQFNYKAAYDLAVQSDGATLPVKFKFGTDAAPVYHTFTNLADLTEFYTGAMAHIQKALETGWKRKDEFNVEDYQV